MQTLNNIDKLLKSSNLDDIKLGIILFCKDKTLEEIKEKFPDDQRSFFKHYHENVPKYLPEHMIEGTEMSVVIFDNTIQICHSSNFSDRNPPQPGELF